MLKKIMFIMLSSTSLTIFAAKYYDDFYLEQAQLEAALAESMQLAEAKVIAESALLAEREAEQKRQREIPKVLKTLQQMVRDAGDRPVDKKQSDLANKECSICQDEILELLKNTIVVQTNCGHQFCEPCFTGIAQTGTKKCPVCRNDIQRVGLVTLVD